MVDQEATAAPSGQGVAGEVNAQQEADAVVTMMRRYLAEGRFVVSAEVPPDSGTRVTIAVGPDATLAAPAPSCAPGEVERIARAICRGEDCPEERWPEYERAAREVAALSPQGLDAATVERNLEAQRQAIEACARLVGGHPMRMDDNVRMTLETAIRSLRPDEALATEPRGGKG